MAKRKTESIKYYVRICTDRVGNKITIRKAEYIPEMDEIIPVGRGKERYRVVKRVGAHEEWERYGLNPPEIYVELVR